MAESDTASSIVAAQSEVKEAQLRDYLSQHGSEHTFAKGETIVRRGERGMFFYLILSGEVEVVLKKESGELLTLRQLVAGNCFGEMAILTNDPVSADVLAITPVTVLAYPAQRFATALAECEPLREKILTDLTYNLRSSSANVWHFYQRAKTFNVMINTSAGEGPLISLSKRMDRVAAQIERLAASNQGLLINGEPGSGKVFLASKIHQAGKDPDRPFFVIDCASIPRQEAASFLFGSAKFASFNEETKDQVLQEYGVLHLANQGTLVLRHVDLMDEVAQATLGRFLEMVREGWSSYPIARVIATTSKDIDDLVKRHGFDARLAGELSRSTITVPPLRERRKDILPLADLFLRETEGRADSISNGAEHVLVSRKYLHRNAAELREAIELAALFSDGEQIRVEHIFTGPKEQQSSLEFPLSDLSLVQRLISDKALSVLRGVVFSCFLLLIFLLVFAPYKPISLQANALVWGVWWPGLIFTFLLLGRMWCIVCPLSTAGRLVGRFKRFNLPFPEPLKKRSIWLITGGFALIVLSEHFFAMNEKYAAAGGLFLTLMGSAVAFTLFFPRETWCRFVCPLGNLSAVFSTSASISVRANPSVCATCCTTHECHKGSDTREGCPVFHHPLFARDGYLCKLCFACLKSCPHGSAKLYLRPPLQRIWRQGEIGGLLSPFALFLVFFALAMLASKNTRWASSPGSFTMVTLFAIALGAGTWSLLKNNFAKIVKADSSMPTRIALTMLVLAWGPMAAFLTEGTTALKSLRLIAEADSFLAMVLPESGITAMMTIQFGELFIAGFLALTALLCLRHKSVKEQAQVPKWYWSALGVFAFGYWVAAVLLTLRISI